IFIDALNVAYWCGDPPSLRMPMTVMTHLLTAGHQALLYFDASARYRLGSEAGLYERLAQHPRYVIEVPSGSAADAVMLRHATSSGACILSRDQYRDYRKRYRRLIDDPTRLMAGTVEQDRLLVPFLALDMALPASVHEAWEQLESLLACPAQRVAHCPGE
ncbi:MAG: NYN domain-containing protein, partial [Solimonas sp.]